MNLQQTRLGLALQMAGVPLSVATFNDRLILQKAIYLLQQADIHLGYRYRWYIRGPYSSGLTEDVFSLAGLPDHGRSELTKWKLDTESSNRISRIKPLFSGKSARVLARHLELLASVLFLIKTNQAPAHDYAKISHILIENEKDFSAEDVKGAIDELIANGYSL